MTERPLEVPHAAQPASAEHPPPSRKRRLLRGVLVAGGLVLLLGGLAAVKADQIGTMMGFGEQAAKAGPPPESVSTARAEQQLWEGSLSAVASVVSEKGVALSNDSAGIVSRLHFDSGAVVKQGQVLVELDTRVERAQLVSLKARRELAEKSLSRSQLLASKGAVPQSQLDNDQATFDSIKADVGALEAEIARKTIRAPFSGKLGLRDVNLGQYLAPGTRVTTLESSDSVFVDFTLPQRNFEGLKRDMVVRAYVEGTKEPLGEGRISAIAPTVDAVTRSAKVRATLPNNNDRLHPGMFVRIEVVLPEQAAITAIPLTSVVHATYGDSVFLVENKPGPNGKPQTVARQQFVKLGEARGDFVSVLEGVKAGQEIVSAGAFKLRNGLPIAVNNEIKPKAELAPRPENQ